MHRQQLQSLSLIQKRLEVHLLPRRQRRLRDEKHRQSTSPDAQQQRRLAGSQLFSHRTADSFLDFHSEETDSLFLSLAFVLLPLILADKAIPGVGTMKRERVSD